LQTKYDNAQVEIKLVRQEVTDLEEKLYTTSSDRGSLDHEVLNLKDLLATKKSEMDRDARSQEKLRVQLQEALESVSKKDEEFGGKVNEIKQYKEQCTKLESLVREERTKFEKSASENETISTRLTLVQQDYDEQVYTINGLMGDTQRQSRELKKWEEEVVKYRDELRNVTRARDALHKRIKGLEEVKAETEFDNDTLRGINHSVLHDLEAAKKELDQQHKLIESVKRDRDIAQKNFVRATGNTQKQTGAVKLADQTKRNLEQEIAGYKDEAAKMRKLIFSLEKDRDRHIAAASKAENMVVGRNEEVKIKEMHLFDANKKITEVEKKLKEQQYMYENVRTERNLYSKNCIEFEDEIIEMKRKLKIMSHQIEQLKEEISNKEQALVKENFEHSQLEKEKESLSIQIGKLQHHTEEAQEMIRIQQAEENKLRHIITETDAERLRQKKEYEAVVQERVSYRLFNVRISSEHNSFVETMNYPSFTKRSRSKPRH
jgi:chromosome segregation ATPase